MADIQVYAALQQYLAKRTISPLLDLVRRKKVFRMANSYVLKDKKLYYTGPSRQYMRLLVLTEDQKRAVLQECHTNPGTGTHGGVRSTRDRVIAGYYWKTLMADVDDWVKNCNHCQTNGPNKAAAPSRPSIKVKGAWEIVAIDLIGPLKETAKKNQYILGMTDLFTKWVVAEPLQTKSASEVSAVIISKLYLLGMVRKIITDEGTEFVNQLNNRLFEVLNLKHAVSSGYHPQTISLGERTNQNIKQALRNCVTEEQDDWDVHLQAVIYGINTAKQRSTLYSPYYLFFHRHPFLPEMMNACPMQETFEVGDPKNTLERRLTDIKGLNRRVLKNIRRAQCRQKHSLSDKQKPVRPCPPVAVEEAPDGGSPKKCRMGDPVETLQDRQDPEIKIEEQESTVSERNATVEKC